MKKFILLITLFSISVGLAKSPQAEIDSHAQLAAQFAFYSKNASEETRLNILDDLDLLTEIQLDQKTDLELIKNALLTLLAIDSIDTPRSAALTLSNSYGHHKELYLKAAAKIQNNKNKDLLKTLVQIMDRFYDHGNG